MSELDPRLLARLPSAAALVPQDMRILVFGSAVSAVSTARDIDILLIYRRGDVLRAHETAVAIRDHSPELDVLALSEMELEAITFANPEHDLRTLPVAWQPPGASRN